MNYESAVTLRERSCPGHSVSACTMPGLPRHVDSLEAAPWSPNIDRCQPVAFIHISNRNLPLSIILIRDSPLSRVYSVLCETVRLSC